MISFQSAVDFYALPDDAATVLPALAGYIAGARQTVRVICYGFDEVHLLAALTSAAAAGIDVKLILDLTQSKGHAEAAPLHALILAIGAANVRIGTSTEHAIIHDKLCCIDGLADVPDGQFATVAAARAAGYPVTIEGSFNWTASAAREMNTVIVLPSKAIARQVHAIFDAQWQWLEQNEPAYQPAGAALAS